MDDRVEAGPPRGGGRGGKLPRTPNSKGSQNWKDLAWVGFDYME